MAARRVGDKKPVVVAAAGAAVDASLSTQEKALRLEYFPEMFLGLKVYEWQFKVLAALNEREAMVLLRAANGSGKTKMIAAVAVVWCMIRFPGLLVVCTAGVYRQVVDALWPYLREYSNGLGGAAAGWNVTESHVHYENGSRCVGFSTDNGAKAEGWHRQGPTDNLLYVIDEAKSVPDAIYEAAVRCQPSRLLIMSSPGAPSGFFYELFKRGGKQWSKFVVTAYDCPHISKESIAQQIEYFGESSAVIQSSIFAEFVDDSRESLILPNSVLQANLQNPPDYKDGLVTAGCDFAAGGDENVIALRVGNQITKLVCWREKDTMRAVERFALEFSRMGGLTADNVYADASGLGIPMCDALRDAGWSVNRVNNGEAAWSKEKYENRGTEMWTHYARMVEKREVRVFQDELLHRQLTTRKLGWSKIKRRLLNESKEDMRARGLGSPDKADAVILAFCGPGVGLEEHMREDASNKQSLWERMEEARATSDYDLEGAEVGS